MDYKPYKEDPADIPTITVDQIWFLQWCLQTWMEIRRKWDTNLVLLGGKPNIPVDIHKSCLMYRLSVEGKAPLPIPPPTSLAAPWYSLIEDGKAGLTQSIFTAFYPYPKTLHEDYLQPFKNDGIPEDYWGFMNIHGHIWCVLEFDDPKYIVTYRYSKGERWVVRPMRTIDPPIVAGQTTLEEGGVKPVYCDWILIREDLDAYESAQD